MQNTVPTNHFDETFLGMLDSLKIKPKDKNIEDRLPSGKERLEANLKELKKKFQNAEGQVKFNYLMELSNIEAQLKNLSN